MKTLLKFLILSLLFIPVNVYALDVTWGTALEFDAGGIRLQSLAGLDSDTFIMTLSNSDNGEATPFNWSGTTPVEGTSRTFDTDIETTSLFSNFACAAKLSTNKFVAFFIDDSGSDDGSSEVADVTDASPPVVGTYGTEKEPFGNEDIEFGNCAGIDTDKVVFCGNAETSGDEGECVACTVSGTTQTCGTPVDYDTGMTDGVARYGNNLGSAKLATDKFVVTWEQEGEGDGQVIAGSVSGTTITMDVGGAVEWSSATGGRNSVCTPNESGGTDDRLIVVEGQGNAYVGTVSTTAITIGSAQNFAAGGSNAASCVFVTEDKFLIAYNDPADNEYLTTILGTVDWGARTATFGSTEQPEANLDVQTSAHSETPLLLLSGFDTDTPKVVLSFSDAGDTESGHVIIGDLNFAVATGSGLDIRGGTSGIEFRGGTSGIDLRG